MKLRFFYIFFLFIISLTILLSLSLFFSNHLESMISQSERIESTYKGINLLEQIEVNLSEMEASQRGYILTRDSLFLQPFIQNISIIPPLIDSVGFVLADKGIENDLVLLKTNVIRRISILQKNIHRALESDTIGFVDHLRRGRELMEICKTDIASIENKAFSLLNRNFTNKRFFENVAPRYFIGLMIFSAILTMVLFFFIIREMRRRLKYQKELEARVNELDRSHADLEQFTFVASHDLQEPLRKIRTFSDRLLSKHSDKLEAEGRMIVNRIDDAANRVQELIQEMVNFTNLIKTNDVRTNVDLNLVLQKVLGDFSELITSRKATVHLEELPVLSGYASQLFILFKSLLDNSFKFSKPGVPTVIHISFTKIHAGEAGIINSDSNSFYYQLNVEDNGIGFENEFAEKIFMIFQRLHSKDSEYRGKGIGLAIAQRVMVNHQGYIRAKAKTGEGATFILYFPA